MGAPPSAARGALRQSGKKQTGNGRFPTTNPPSGVIRLADAGWLPLVRLGGLRLSYKITLPLQGSGHCCQCRKWVGLAKSFIVSESEPLAFENWTADIPAKLVPLERGV